MGQRQDLHQVLKSLFTDTPHVYFQPPASVTLVYPCIVYKLDEMPAIHADNQPYHWDHRYQLTVIDRDPDSQLRERVASVRSCKMIRGFESDNLHHFVFSIYY